MCVCVYASVCVSAWVGQLSPGRFLLTDLRTQPLPNPKPKYHSRRLFLPRVERSEDGGNVQQLRSGCESLFSWGSGKSFPPFLTHCFPRTLFSLCMSAGKLYSPAFSWPCISQSCWWENLGLHSYFVIVFLGGGHSRVLYLQVHSIEFPPAI